MKGRSRSEFHSFRRWSETRRRAYIIDTHLTHVV